MVRLSAFDNIIVLKKLLSVVNSDSCTIAQL